MGAIQRILKKAPVKYGLLAVVLLLVCLIGFEIGRSSNTPKETKAASQPAAATDSQDEAEMISDTIALVNLDSGTLENGEMNYYAQKLLEDVGREFVQTGLEDAKRGVENGIYGGYVVIPATFSESAVSLNTTPAKAELEYKINTNLTKEVLESVIYDIAALQRTMNNDLSYMYISSILDTFHSSQDDVKKVLANDTSDTEALLRIQPYDLVTLVKTPEMKNENMDFEPLDIQEYLANNQVLVSTINTKYAEYIALSQEDLEAIKTESTGLGITIGAATDVVNSINLVQDEEGNIIYQAALNELNTSFSEYNDQVKIKNEDIKTRIDQYKLTVDTAQKHLDASIKKYNEDLNTTDSTNKVGREAAVNAIMALIQKDNGTEDLPVITASASGDKLIVSSKGKYVTVDLSVDPADGTLDIAALASDLNAASDTVYSKDSKISKNELTTILNASIPDYDGVAIDPDTELPIVDENNEKLAVSDELTELSKDIQADIDNEVVKIPSLDTESIGNKLNDEIIKPLVDRTDLLKTKLLEQLDLSDKQLEVFSQVVNDYDPFAKINQEEISGYVGDISKNGEKISQTYTENSTKQTTLMQKVIDTSQENVTNLQKSVSEASSESEKAMTEKLEDVKRVRNENSANNQGLLTAFTEKLPYTRLGTVEYTDTYKFMAEPLRFVDKTPTKVKGTAKSLSSGDEKATPEKKQNDTLRYGVVLYCAFGLLAIVLIVIIVRMLLKKE